MRSVQRGSSAPAAKKWLVGGTVAVIAVACAYKPVTVPDMGGAGTAPSSTGGSPSGPNGTAGSTTAGSSPVTTGGAQPSAGTQNSAAGSGGSSMGGGAPAATNPNFTFTKITLHTRFLAEAVAIGDYNKDGTLDIAAGRRWYAGPFAPNYNVAAGEHAYRDGHEDLPTTGAEIEINTGVSDSWSAHGYDMNGDGWDDIVQISASDMGPKEANGGVVGATNSITAGTGFWYQNPQNMGAGNWAKFQISDDMKGEHKVYVDMTGDGKPEILGAAKNSNPIETWGYWQADWANPSALWTYHPVTRTYPFKDGCCGWLHGLGAGDVNGDGKLDLLERSGIWLQPAAAGMPWTFYNVAFSIPEFLGTEPDIGGANMYAYDVDDDGMNDVVTSLNSHGFGLAWFKQGPAGTFSRQMIMNTPEEKATYNNVAVSQLHTLWLEDMDGDGLRDIVTGKTWLAHPYTTGDAGGNDPVEFYVFKLVRTPTVHFEPHLVDADNGNQKAAGGAREIVVTDMNNDGLKDIVVSSKRGLFVYLGKP
jgi:hypothetical protein